MEDFYDLSSRNFTIHIFIFKEAFIMKLKKTMLTLAMAAVVT